MKNSNHIIQKHTFDITCEDENLAYDLQERTLSLMRDSLYKICEEVFQEIQIPNPNLQFKVEELVLDLGSISTHEFENELTMRYKEALREKLTKLIGEAKVGGIEASVEVQSINQTLLQLFIHLSKDGVLPWWGENSWKNFTSDQPLSFENLFLALWENSRESLLRVIQKNFTTLEFQKRIASLLSDDSLVKLSLEFSSSNQQFIKTAILELPTSLKSKFWQIILKKVLLESKTLTWQDQEDILQELVAGINIQKEAWFETELSPFMQRIIQQMWISQKPIVRLEAAKAPLIIKSLVPKQYAFIQKELQNIFNYYKTFAKSPDTLESQIWEIILYYIWYSYQQDSQLENLSSVIRLELNKVLTIQISPENIDYQWIQSESLAAFLSSKQLKINDYNSRTAFLNQVLPLYQKFIIDFLFVFERLIQESKSLSKRIQEEQSLSKRTQEKQTPETTIPKDQKPESTTQKDQNLEKRAQEAQHFEKSIQENKRIQERARLEKLAQENKYLQLIQKIAQIDLKEFQEKIWQEVLNYLWKNRLSPFRKTGFIQEITQIILKYYPQLESSQLLEGFTLDYGFVQESTEKIDLTSILSAGESPENELADFIQKKGFLPWKNLIAFVHKHGIFPTNDLIWFEEGLEKFKAFTFSNQQNIDELLFALYYFIRHGELPQTLNISPKTLIAEIYQLSPDAIINFVAILEPPVKLILKKENQDVMQRVFQELNQTSQRKKLNEFKEMLQKGSQKLSVNETIYVHNAGLVLLNPYIPKLFKLLKYTDKEGFVGQDEAFRAAYLLQFICAKNQKQEEYELAFNKVLCGIPLTEVLPADIELTEQEKSTAEGMLNGVVNNWSALKSTDIDNLRATFLLREGRLTSLEESWRLVVEERGFDVLLDYLPWSFSLISFPWMDKVLSTEWRES